MLVSAIIDGMKSMYFSRSLQPAKPITNLDDSVIKARDIVVSAGIASGNEHGVAVSVATGEIVQRFTSDSPKTISIPKIDESVIIHHNHPLGDGLSIYDLVMLLIRKDIDSVYAHGHDNQYAYAKFNQSVKEDMALMIKMRSLESISRQIATKINSDHGIQPPMGVSFYLSGLIAQYFNLVDDYKHNPPLDIYNYLNENIDIINEMLKEFKL